MEFSEFAKILKPIIGGSYNTAVFTSTLFEVIIDEDYLPLIEGTSTNTLKSYYNGHTKITKMARVILPYVDPELFSNYLGNFPEATTQRLCGVFEAYIGDIDLYNATEKIAYYFENILRQAADGKRKSTTTSAKDTKGNTPSKSSVDDNSIKELDENTLNDNDKAFLNKLRTDVKPLLKYCIDHDPAAGPTRLTLADEISVFIDEWKYEVREIKDTALRVLTNDIMKVLSEYTYYISDEFLRLLPDGNALWFRNESWEEGERLRNVLQPESYKKRCEIRDLYLRLYPIPEDNSQHEPAKTIIEHQTNIVQNGDNNVNVTNNGTININL